jgi:hypothetical protein
MFNIHNIVKSGLMTAATVTLASALIAGNKPIRLKERHMTYDGLAVSATPVLPPREVPVSLWFKKEDIPALKAKREDKVGKEFWKRVKNSRFMIKELPGIIKKEDSIKDIHEYYGTMSQIAAYNAFAFLMAESSDPDRETYRDVATRALKRSYDGPVYEFDPRDKNAVDEIYRATWNQNFAAAYDWIKADLTPAEDKMIRPRLIREAKYCSANLLYWASSPHNHLSKPAWGLGSLALALCGENDAATWLKTALVASNMNTRYFFSRDGLYREGSHYFLFSALNLIPFMYHYRNVSGINTFENFQPMFEYILSVRNGKGWLPNIEDSFIRPFPTNWLSEPYQNSATKLSKNATLGQLLQWNYFNTDYTPFETIGKTSGFNYTGASWDFPLELVNFITWRPDIEAKTPDLDGTKFMECGLSIFRNTYNQPNKQLYLLFQGVPEADNHNHSDQLSFISFAYGQMMASDSGYTRKSYGEKVRKEWYITPEAHNVVTFNGKAPVDAVENKPAASTTRFNGGAFDFEEKSAPFSGKTAELSRSIAFPGQFFFVVIDRVTGNIPGNIASYFHGGRAALENRSGSWMWSFSKDQYGPAAKMYNWIVSREPVKTEIRQGEITYLKDDYKAFPYMVTSVKSSTLLSMNIMFPQSADSRIVPCFTEFKGKDFIGAKITADNIQLTVAATEATGTIKAGDLQFKGKFCGTFSYDGKLQSIMGQQVTEIRLNGKQVMTSNQPISLVLDYRTGRNLKVDFSADSPANVTLYLNGQPQTINISKSQRLEFNL